MAWEQDNDLERAIERLTVQEVWRRLELPNCPREGNVVCKSPFREDRHGKSFSICYYGRGWRDHAEGSQGGVWQFAQRATGKQGKELADLLIGWSGISRTVRIRDVVKQLQDGVDPKNLPANARRLLRRDEQRKKEFEAQRRLEHERFAALNGSVSVRRLHEWPQIVRACYVEGYRTLRGDGARIAAWAKERGWPEHWVGYLIDEGLISAPWLPWSDPDDPRACRGKAFRVDAPVLNESGEYLQSLHLGYHQRFRVAGENGQPGRKSWVYVPYAVGLDKIRTSYQREMRAAIADRLDGSGEGLVPALPFVMGSLGRPRFLLIAEGQWDAVTFAGAAGWLESDTSWPVGAVIMGIRGVSGLDTMLAYWRPWLSAHRPAVMVLTDNDAAGARWTSTKPASPTQAPPPTLVEKLEFAKVRRVYVSKVDPRYGKDFNDYFRAKHPTQSDMHAWLERCGFISRDGQWI